MGLDMYMHSRTKDKGVLTKLIANKSSELGCDTKEYMSEYSSDNKLIEVVQEVVGKEYTEQLGYFALELLKDGYEVSLGSWRKANFIHNWFVDNVQGGIDDCDQYLVSEDQLNELYDLSNQVLDVLGVDETINLDYGEVSKGNCKLVDKDSFQLNVSEEVKKKVMDLLPTIQGFFFGGQDIDYYYLSDLMLTKEIIKKALADIEKGNTIYYSSSW